MVRRRGISSTSFGFGIRVSESLLGFFEEGTSPPGRGDDGDDGSDVSVVGGVLGYAPGSVQNPWFSSVPVCLLPRKAAWEIEPGTWIE